MAEPMFTPVGEGERITEREHRVLVELPHLEALILCFEQDCEGVDPHTHADHTDSFYVLDGEVEFWLDGAWRPAGPGTFVSAPPNAEHGFRPAGTGPISVLNIHAPNVGFIERLRS
jgi:quercetin dioxygenase-like cupin family protein